MAPDTATGDGKAELIPIGAIALAGVEVDPGRTQPADCQILELVADFEDPQRLAAEIRAVVLWRACKLKLQGALAGMPQPRCTEIGPGRRHLALCNQCCVDQCVDPVGHGGARVEIQCQNGTSAVAARRDISAP
jgi:hypothetical protein